MTNQIPKDVLESFVICNSAPNDWQYKRLFYDQIKTPMLKEYGKPAGQDLQVIKKVCHSCSGSGIYQSYVRRAEKCNRCTDGIYMIHKIVLDRYILNDEIFHCPTRLDWKEIGLFNKVFVGLIEHKPAKNCPDIELFEVIMFYKKFTNIRQCMDFIREDNLPF